MHSNAKPHHASAVLDGTGYAGMTVTKVPGWHGMIAVDALLNGMATGLFLTAAIGELAAPAAFTHVAKLAYPIALVLLLIDLGLLVLDLGDPLRFHHMLRTFRPGSPMSFGTWCLTIFSLPLSVAAAFSVLALVGFDFRWPRPIAVVLGLLPGFLSAAYKGVLLSTNSQPGWKDARWMGGYLTNSAILMGCGELLILTSLTGQDQASAILRTAFLVLLVMNLVPLVMLFGNLRHANAQLYTSSQQWGIFILVALGTLVPLVLMLVNSALLLRLIAVIVLLAQSWLVRSLFVRIPHTPPMETRSA